VQDAAVPCNCPSCGASLVILPSSVLGQVGEKTGNVEAELDFASALAEYRDGTERRYPVADVDGHFTCPACRALANVADVEPLILLGRSNTVSILLNATGHCVVPNLWGWGLAAAKRGLLRANCRVGMTQGANSKTVSRGHVISERPKPGTVLRKGGKVNLVVSRGRKH
jgi:PASTA domain